LLDTRYRVEIPGGIQLEAQVVGPIPRAFAFAIDLIIRGVIIIVLWMASIPLGLGGMGGGVFLIFLFVIEWLYPVLFEIFARGQTPGKKMFGISVINDDLSPVTLGTSLVRNLLRTVDFLPLFYLVGVVAMLSNRRFQRLGDMAAGTLVISVREAPKPAAMEDVVPLAPSMLRSSIFCSAAHNCHSRGSRNWPRFSKASPTKRAITASSTCTVSAPGFWECDETARI